MTVQRQRYAGKCPSWWLWVGYWIVLFALTHVPVSGMGGLPGPHTDKFIHVGLYFLLTWLGGRHYAASSGLGSSRVLFAWAAGYAVYAVLDESLQPLFTRTPSLGDWVADVAGILLATALLVRRPGSTGLSEPSEAG